MKSRKIFWVEPDRFDLKPDKSTWVEMGRTLCHLGYRGVILTGYKNYQYLPEGNQLKMLYFKAIDRSLIFRVSLLVNILFWLLKNSEKDSIVMLTPPSLIIAPILKIFRHNSIHLDIRTIPVNIEGQRDKIDSFFYWFFTMKFCRQFAKTCSFITERLRKDVESQFNIHFEDYVIWQSGVNSQMFKPDETQKTEKHSSEFTLFYHGSLYKNRGLDVIIESIAYIGNELRSKIVFVVVGDGPFRQDLEKCAAYYGVSENVHFKGLLPYEKMPNEIHAADCCICPLPNRPEWNVSSPLKVFEYLACGKPMILTKIPAHQDILPEQNNFIIWSKGEGALDFKEAIEKAYEKRQELRIAALKGPKIVQKSFEWEAQGARLASYLDRHYGLA